MIPSNILLRLTDGRNPFSSLYLLYKSSSFLEVFESINCIISFCDKILFLLLLLFPIFDFLIIKVNIFITDFI